MSQPVFNISPRVCTLSSFLYRLSWFTTEVLCYCFLCPCITRSFQIYWENSLVVVLYFLLALYFPWKVLYTLYCAIFCPPEVILWAFEKHVFCSKYNAWWNTLHYEQVEVVSEVAEVQLLPQQEQEVVAPRISNLSAATVRRVSSNHALSQGSASDRLLPESVLTTSGSMDLKRWNLKSRTVVKFRLWIR